MADSREGGRAQSGLSKAVGAVLRVASFVAVWLLLTEGDIATSWLIGVPTVILATMATYRIEPRHLRRVQLSGLLRFIPFFLVRSVVGGLDVALRALRPSRPLDPGFVEYRLRVAHESLAALFFVEIISLLPGTLCAELQPEAVVVHVVNRHGPVIEELTRLEVAVADIFGEPISGAHTPGGQE